MTDPQKTHTPKFQLQVAIDALSGKRTVDELAAEFDISPDLVRLWKRQLEENAETIFPNRRKKQNPNPNSDLIQQRDRLAMELAWLKKKLGVPPEEFGAPEK